MSVSARGDAMAGRIWHHNNQTANSDDFAQRRDAFQKFGRAFLKHEVKDPEGLAEHQVLNLTQLEAHRHNDFPYGILTDPPGLGKTRSSLAVYATELATGALPPDAKCVASRCSMFDLLPAVDFCS